VTQRRFVIAGIMSPMVAAKNRFWFVAIRAQSMTQAFVLPSMLAWAAMMASYLLTGLVSAAYFGLLDYETLRGLLAALVFHSIPFAFLVVVIYFPLMLAIRRVRHGASPTFLGAVGMVAAPFALLAVSLVAGAIWGPIGFSLPELLATLLALTIGGLTFGVLSCRFMEPRSKSPIA
jgi:hypothetical protein